MASTTSERFDRMSPPKYRRQTLATYPDVYGDNSMWEALSRPTSALDRKWVHRSQSDLTTDLELQISHPRLQTDFYQELYKKYPNAFRRQEQRLAGRRLFNSRPQVRFDDEVEFLDERGSMTSLHFDGSNRHLTNWDKEVGHYLKQRSRSRECVTSVEPSECSGSVLSLTQRLRLNSQTLNKLLNEQSPLRRKFEKDRVQYDSGTENEQSLQDYLLDKSRTRSRNRTKHRVLQRKIDNQANGANDIIFTDVEHSRRWMSKSVSPRGRLFSRSPISQSPRSPRVKNRNTKKSVDIDILMADTDLKIDTLIEKMGKEIFIMDSPPDSAIDVHTPSMQSFVTGDKGSNSQRLYSDQRQLPTMNGFGNGESDKRNEHVDSESSPGSSVSARFRENDDGILTVLSTGKGNETEPFYAVSEKLELENGANKLEMDEIKTIVNKFTNSNTSTQNYTDTGPGLLQFYTEKLENELSNETVAGRSHDVLRATDNGTCGEYSNEQLEVTNPAFNSGTKDKMEFLEHNMYSGSLPSHEKEGGGGSPCQAADNSNYLADDEEDGCELVAIATKQDDKKMAQKMYTHRDSDVDSGIGHSSTGTDARTSVSSLPPRGRLKQRETTQNFHPMKGDHSLIPSRSDVDSCILDEVNLEKLSHDLTRRGRNSKEDEADDTDIRLGVAKVTVEEHKLAERYRRARSPSPYILTNRGQPSPVHRPHSAPSFLSGDLEMRIIDISLSNESLSDLSSNVSSLNKDTSKTAENFSVSKNSNSCQSSETTVSSNLTCIAKTNTNGDIQNEQSVKSSSLSKQRKYSSSSVSSDESYNSHISKAQNEDSGAIHNGNHQRHDRKMQGFAKYETRDSNEFPRAVKSVVMNAAANYGETGAMVNDVEYSGADSSNKYSEETNTMAKYSTNTYMAVAADRIAENAKVEDGQREERVHEKKGIYKPSVTSPRVKEKRLKLRNILKNKKGSYTPTPTGEVIVAQPDGRNAVNRIYAKDRQTGKESSLPQDSDSNKSDKNLGTVHRTLPSIPSEFQSNRLDNSPREATLKGLNSSQNENKKGNSLPGRVTPYEAAASKERDCESIDNFISGTSSNTFTAKPVLSGNHEVKSRVDAATENETHPREVRPQKNEPPVKPARTKHRNLAPDLNLSKYKITPDGSTNIAQTNIHGHVHGQSNRPSSTNSQDLGASVGHSSKENLHPGHVSTSSSHTSGSLQNKENEIEVLPPEKSNLQKSKGLSASKGSLLGDFKTATKGKFKALRKAMSFEQGIDNCGVEQSGHSSKDGKGGHSGFPKIKKAPSLKSLTSLFTRKKKKKGKLSSDDTGTSSTRGSTQSISSEHSGPITDSKHQQWASCHSLSPVESPVHHQPIGKLQQVNPDGTQIIQLIKPQTGPIGFFIAKGSAKYRNGIFVSRFSDDRPESLFAGLLGIGDEILEINGHFVRDLSQDAVYNLISASPIVIMKVFPFIARKDV